MSEPHRIEPFPALMFDAAKAGPLGDLIAPPYDLVDTIQQEALYARNPHNVIRLELNHDADPYSSAAATLDQWRRDGVLARQSPPALFHYTQRFKIDGKELSRGAIIARVRLEPFSRGRILPHEKTFPKAKEDRLRLLITTRTNISPIFGLYSSPGDESEALLAAIVTRDPAHAATDDAAVEHEIRTISALDEITVLQRAFEDVRILIADGHHRYETALEYQRRRHAEEGVSSLRGYDYVMMALVAFDDPGLVILPTHRIIHSIPPPVLASFTEKAREHFDLVEFPSGEDLLAVIAGRGHGAIGAILKGQPPRLLMLRDPLSMAAAAPDLPTAVRELDVARLHALILNGILGINADQVRRGGDITYTIDGSAAMAAVADGNAAAAFLMTPPSVEDVARVSASGATMPEKSTYFFPKLVTGMVLNPLYDPA
jgi:uncharacterized protein (DUF1015 family)